MKVAMYTSQLCYAGGIERVVKELFRIFGERGVQCCAVCEYGLPTWGELGCFACLPQKKEVRCEFLRKWLLAHKPDVFLFHYVKDEKFIYDDLKVLKELNITSFAVMHSSFPSPLLLDGDELLLWTFQRWAKYCNGIITVSKVDMVWWRALGFRAWHIQNPFVHPKMNALHLSRSSETAPRKVLWVGRQAQQKQPSAALAAFAAVTRTVPDAHLTMVGGSEAGWKRFRRQAKRLGLTEEQVTFLSERDDISDLWEWADIHLLSSVTESFCLVLAEAKAWGKPTVMFEIPFLELVESGKGLVSVPQGDIQALADGMVNLMTHPQRCQQLGKEAQESLTSFNDDAVWRSWQKILGGGDGLGNSLEEVDLPADVRVIITQMAFAWEDFCKRNLWAVVFVRNWRLLFGYSLKPISQLLEWGITLIRRVKRAVARYV